MRKIVPWFMAASLAVGIPMLRAGEGPNPKSRIAKKDAETENKDFDEPPRPTKSDLAKGGNG